MNSVRALQKQKYRGHPNIVLKNMKHKEHRAIDRAVLRQEFPKVHRWMDQPAWRCGPGHRKYRHDARAVVLMALRERDPRAGVSALLHIAADFAPGEIVKLLQEANKR
jgi:hypothetical protein